MTAITLMIMLMVQITAFAATGYSYGVVESYSQPMMGPITNDDQSMDTSYSMGRNNRLTFSGYSTMTMRPMVY